MTDGRNELADLCALASAAAEKQGHELDDWIRPDGADAIGLRAACRRCGRVAYVRAESSMQGIAGAALREPCRA